MKVRTVLGLASVLPFFLLAGCGGGGGEPAGGGPASGQTGPATEETTAEATMEETTMATAGPGGTPGGETTLSPYERELAASSLLECQLEEAEGELGYEGLGKLVDEMADERMRRPNADFGQLLAERGYTCGRMVSP